jgi:hypothetical protein
VVRCGDTHLCMSMELMVVVVVVYTLIRLDRFAR